MLDLNDAYAIAKYIKDAEKQTPVKIYVSTTAEIAKSENFKVFGNNGEYTLIGDYKTIMDAIAPIKDQITDMYIENAARNSAIPMIDMLDIDARIEPHPIKKKDFDEESDYFIKEVINTQLDRSIHNLKEEVKNFIINGEKIIQAQFSHQIIGDKANKKEKGDEKGKKQKQTFFDKIGYKFVEFDFDHEIGNEYLIFVLDHINEFFLERVIIDNIDANMENKNIIAQTFKTVNKTDMLTQNNINKGID